MDMEHAEDWWLAYGNFRRGVGNLPHFGDVISQGCGLLGLNTRQFASLYGCTIRYAQMLGNDSNMNQPKDLEKRRLLATILKVSPLLFGLPVLSEEANRTVIEYIGQHHLLAYEDVLSLCWQLYYTGDFQAATKNIPLWLYSLENSISEASGVGKDQLLSYQSKFLQLSATSLREKGVVNAALKDSTKALKIAKELGNPELIVSSLHHRFRIYVEREEWDKSLKDIKEALSIIKEVEVSDLLKGTIFVDAGEAFAAVAIDACQCDLQQKALTYFDKAASLARSLPTSTEGKSYLRFSLSKVMNEKAANAATFGMKQEASDSIRIAQKTLPPDNIGWTRDHLLSSADIKICLEEDVTGCYTNILESIVLHEATKSKSNGKWMWRMHEKCKDIEPNNKYVPVVEQKLQAYS
jgi:tetratricopeptide (TPR) repeat protein